MLSIRDPWYCFGLFVVTLVVSDLKCDMKVIVDT